MEVVIVKQGHVLVLVLFMENHVIYPNVLIIVLEKVDVKSIQEYVNVKKALTLLTAH